jgi:hypothetical protein
MEAGDSPTQNFNVFTARIRSDECCRMQCKVFESARLLTISADTHHDYQSC